VNQQVRIGEQGRRGDKKYRRRQITGHIERFGEQLAAAICAGESVNSNRPPVFLDSRPKFLQGQLGVIPGFATAP